MKNKSLIYVLIAIALAITIGSITGTEASIFGVTFFSIFDLLGQLFLNLLMLIVVPLISSSIITGMVRMGKEHSIGRISFKMFGMFILTNVLAISVGVLLVNLFLDKFYLSAKAISIAKESSGVLLKTPSVGTNFSDLLLSIIPQNILYALSKGHMLSIIFFSIVFGYVLTKVSQKSQEILIGFFQAVFNSMIQFTHLVMKFLPVGVFFLVAKEFSQAGIETLKPIALYTSMELLGVAIIVFIIFPLLLKFLGKVHPLRHFKAMLSPIITAFSTSSSSATLPVTIDCLEKKAKVSNKICSLVTPLGSSINLTSTAMHIYIASAFIAAAYGVKLDFHTQTTIFLLCVLTTLGVASVPSGCLMTLMIVITTLGIPASGIGLIIVVDRILDMFRTSGNVFGVSTNAVIIARLEGEKNILPKQDLSIADAK